MRLEFARKHQTWNNLEWDKVIFTDETFIRTEAPRNQRIICKESERDILNNAITKKGSRGEGVMFWGRLEVERNWRLKR